MRDLRKQLFFSLVFLASLLQPTLSFSQTPTAEVIEGAKKEGRVVWYTTMNLTTAKELINRFKEKYPFIKPEIMRAGGGILLNRILAETKAGKYDWDVVLGRGEIYLPLRERKLLIPYRSPEFGAFPDDLKDNEGYWTSVYINPNILGYNTELVAKKDVPTTYQDLLDAKWKGGKLSVDTEAWALLSGLSKRWGREKTVAYLKKLAAQEPALKRGNSLRAQLVAAGESHLAIAYAGTVQVFTNMGAPIDWVPLEPVVVQVYPIMLGAKAPHPNAARLFIDFVLSRESQKVIRDAARVPSRTDVEPNPPRLIKFDRIVENPEGFTDLNNTVKLFGEIFGLR